MDNTVTQLPLPPKTKRTVPILAGWLTGLVLLGVLSVYPPGGAALVLRLPLVAWISTGVAYWGFKSSHATTNEKIRNIVLAAILAATVTYVILTSPVNPEEGDLGLSEAIPSELRIDSTIGVFLAVVVGGLIGFQVASAQKKNRRRRRRQSRTPR